MTTITETKTYIPNESEEYMNKLQIGFFKFELLKKRDTLQSEWEDLSQEVHSSADLDSEEFDKANRDILLFVSVKRLEAIQKSIEAIDFAISDIETGTYGFCKKTGKKIGLQRLFATPEARFCIEEQEGMELQYEAA